MKNVLLSDQIISFLQGLPPTLPLPGGAELLFPYADPEVRRVVYKFYNRYYADQNNRIFILGINPGRHGSGVTGIAFTDPLRLRQDCQLEHSFPAKPELSSVYIYELIAAFGSVEKFYRHFYLNSVCPLGFTKAGKNMNYYDDKDLCQYITPFIVDSIRAQLAFGLSSKVAICLGEGKNYNFLLKLNAEFHFFEKIIATPHPRFVMQYKRKTKADYIARLAETMNGLI